MKDYYPIMLMFLWPSIYKISKITMVQGIYINVFVIEINVWELIMSPVKFTVKILVWELSYGIF